MSLYNTRDAFDTYVFFLALKRHFTTDYDFFKYNGKVKASSMSFENRKDKFFFYKLSKMKERKQFILSNVVNNPKIWVGDLFDDRATEVYQDWLKRVQTLTYVFKTELSELEEDFDTNLLVKDGQHPRLLQLYIRRRISLETLVIINELTGCFRYWNKKVSDNILLPDINNLVCNYRPFLEFDKDKMRKVIVDKFAHTT